MATKRAMLAYKFRLYPSKTQAKSILEMMETCRRIYNAALQERSDCWQLYYASETPVENRTKVMKRVGRAGKDGVVTRQKGDSVNFSYNPRSVTFDEQVKRWSVRRNLDLDKGGCKFLKRVPAVVVRDVLQRLDQSFSNFFTRCKKSKSGKPDKAAGTKMGYPLPKRRGQFNSLPYRNYGSGCGLYLNGKLVKSEQQLPPAGPDGYVSGCKLSITNAGLVNICLHRPITGVVKTASVKVEAGEWYAVLVCEVEPKPVPSRKFQAVGIDLGIGNFAAMTDESGREAIIPNPKYYSN